MAKIKICLDAGHFGDVNQSPIVPEYYEAQAMWKLTELEKKYLEAYNDIEVLTTRPYQEEDLDLYTRGAMAAGCNVFISNHSNAAGVEAVDRAVAIGTLNGKAEALARILANTVTEVMGLNDRPQYYTKSNSSGTDYYGVLRGAAAVGVSGFIMEHSFHTNKRAALWLLKDVNLDVLARAEAKAIAQFYGVVGADAKDSEVIEDGLLEVTGIWDRATTIETQKIFDSIVDGIISGQPADNKPYLYSADPKTWEFIPEGPAIGSNVIRILQHFIGADEDGYFGKQSVIAFQKKLLKLGYYEGEIDGSMGPLTVTAWQQYLNEH